MGGVLHTEGERWREERRFILHNFRDFGIGKNVMQERVLAEVEQLLADVDTALDTDAEEELDLGAGVDRCVGSVINAMLFGYRLDEVSREIVSQIRSSTPTGLHSPIMDFHPHI